MSKDLLSEAAQALRETEEASEFEARSTRARMLTGLHQTTVLRRTRLVFLLPIAATFVAVSAWGATNGKAQQAFATLSHWLSPAPPAPPVHVNVHVHVHDLPSPSPSAPTVIAAPDLIPVPPPTQVQSPAASAFPRQSVAQRPEPNDPTLALYRAAHAAHFVNHDPARALAGWDAYLAAAPNGPFAPEARYNRALSLVRLARNSEARIALEPFASGTYGGYRKAEASALLERLSE